MKKSTLLLYLLFLLLFSCSKDNPTVIEDPYKDFSGLTKQLLEDLEKVVIPISGSDPDLNDSDLSFLDQFKDTKIVAVGEATHGTKEFFQMKHRIFKYLVEHHNFKVFGFEADYAESLPVNKYVLTGEGDLDHLMKNVMHFWTWRTEEVKVLLQWMRNYNSGKSYNDKIHFLGYDCQIKEYYPQMIKDYLQKVDSDYLSEVDSVLSYINDQPYDYFSSMSHAKFLEYKDFFTEMANKFEENKNHYINLSSEYDFATSLQLVKVIQQIARENQSTTINFRDEYMAENHSWILDLFGTNTKIVSWAHNGHIFNDPVYWGGGSMGSYLRREFAEDYKIIGFGFSQGWFQAMWYNTYYKQYTGLQNCNINIDPKFESSNYLLHNLNLNNYCLDMSKLTSGALYNYFSESKPFITIGAVYNGNPGSYYRDYKLTEALDLLIYFDQTNAAVPLR